MTQKPFNAREEAVLALMEITENKGYSSIVLDRRIRAYPPSVDLRDKALVTHLVYESLAHLSLIDHVLDQYSRTPVRKMKPYIAAVLRTAAAQMLFDTKIPRRAAVYEAVELVKHSRWKGLSGFVNGVLRAMDRQNMTYRLPEEPLQRLSLQYSLPEDMLRVFEQGYGLAMAEELAVRLATEPAVQVRVNQILETPEGLQKELEEQLGADQVRGSAVCPGVFTLERAEGIGSWPAMTEGRMTVQNESSVLAARLTLARPGQKVLDMCAAPGGKSAVIAEMLENQGQVISCDIHEHKIRLMEELKERLHLTVITPLLQDGTLFREDWEQAFDVVLLDAPCSGFGIVRSKPDIRWNRTVEDIGALSALQRTLLANAARYVKPGGRLVYSTCTIDPAENEENVRWFLSEFKDYRPADIEKDLPSAAMCDTIKGDSDGIVILPEERGRDGFFMAAFIRK